MLPWQGDRSFWCNCFPNHSVCLLYCRIWWTLKMSFFHLLSKAYLVPGRIKTYHFWYVLHNLSLQMWKYLFTLWGYLPSLDTFGMMLLSYMAASQRGNRKSLGINNLSDNLAGARFCGCKVLPLLSACQNVRGWEACLHFVSFSLIWMLNTAEFLLTDFCLTHRSGNRTRFIVKSSHMKYTCTKTEWSIWADFMARA